MAFYYPPGCHRRNGADRHRSRAPVLQRTSDVDSTRTTEKAVSLCGPAGTVSIVNFDSWHRAIANVSKKNRFTLKFQFIRMKEPEESEGDGGNGAWESSEDDRLDGLLRDVWDWHSGESAPRRSDLGNDSIDRLIQSLRHRDETERLAAAYTLGALGEEALPSLLDALHSEAENQLDEEVANTPANPQGRNPSELGAAYALSAVDGPAVPALIEELEHARWACARRLPMS